MSDRHHHALGRAMHALAALAIAAPLAFAALAALPTPARADDGLKITAHALLHGRVRPGSWYAIAVDVENSGPTVTGELHVLGGTDGHTRFGEPAELATGSRKQFVLFAQPNAWTQDSATVELASGDRVVASAKVDLTFTDATTLTVGVLADNPAKLIGEISLLPSTSGTAPALVPMSPSDLPERVQAWAALDRLVWQDVDASALDQGQLAALRAWVAAGGHLVIVGGTAGPSALSALPDDLLPYRPTGTLDIDPAVLRPILGGVPDRSAPLPALVGTLAHGRALASSGDRTVAADMTYGVGSITLLGFDPTTSWLAKGDTWDTPLWRRILPARSVDAGGSLSDDSMLVSGATNLQGMTLPSTGGLLALLIAYIVLIGPVNYTVLRVLDRREWAWVTVPVLIATFTAGAFGVGVLARGSDVILHQVAIVHGAPSTDQATAQAWTAVFSPSRTTFQLSAQGDTLLSAPINGDSMTGQSSSALDVLEGDTTRIRDMPVGYGSVRAVRAEGTTTGPVVDADLHLDGSTIRGTVTNRSSVPLLGAAVVLGSTVQKLGDIAAGGAASVALDVTMFDPNGFTALSDSLVGMSFCCGGQDEQAQRQTVRHMVIDQLTQNAMGMGIVVQGGQMTGGAVMAPAAVPMGMPASSLSSSVLLVAWGTSPVLALDIQGTQPRQTADVLFEIPMRVSVSGNVRFTGDLLPGTVTSMTAASFSKDPTAMWMDTGSMATSYRPVPFEGRLTPSSVTISMNHPGDMSMPGGTAAEAPIGGRCVGTAGCSTTSTFPDVDVFDVGTGQWVELGALTVGTPYTLPDPARWVDPTTGEVQVRFVNQSRDQLGFHFLIAVEGTVQ